VASSIGNGDSLAGAAELPAGLVAHIDANRQAAAAGQGGEEEEQLTESELGDRLQQLAEQQLAEQELAEQQRAQAALLPPSGFLTWQDAVRDAFDGWDFGDNLQDNSYAEVFAAPVLERRPPTIGQFDPAAMAQEDQEQLLLEQQQRLATQQQMQRSFQQAGMTSVAAALQQHMLQEHYVQPIWRRS
jgi:hypothetical protein